jgi:hypothetical protein
MTNTVPDSTDRPNLGDMTLSSPRIPALIDPPDRAVHDVPPAQSAENT